MSAPAFGNDVIWSAVHAAQSHIIINDIISVTTLGRVYSAQHVRAVIVYYYVQ